MVCKILTAIVNRGWGVRRLWLLLLPLLLSGCLRYDLTLRFDHQSHGQILQTIDLSDRGAALAQPTLAPWLEQLRVRSRPLGGQLIAPRQPPQTVTLAVPFSTAADLVERFQQVFADPEAGDTSADTAYLQLPGWGPVPFALAVEQRNWLLASRTHLTYRLDLQTLPPNPDSPGPDSPGPDGSGPDSSGPDGPSGPSDPAPWADLRFRLQVPWGLAQIAPTATPPLAVDGTGATWPLAPGTTTAIDVVFWLPNPIAIGSLGIVALVLAGYGLRYRILKPVRPS